MDKYFVNDRFIELYKKLEQDNKIEGKRNLAILMNVKPATISEIIAKRQGITTSFIQKFCDIFPEFSPNDFFNKRDEPYEHPDSVYEDDCYTKKQDAGVVHEDGREYFSERILFDRAIGEVKGAFEKVITTKDHLITEKSKRIEDKDRIIEIQDGQIKLLQTTLEHVSKGSFSFR